MSGPATTRWARTLVDELARAGVREVAVAPGSRSTPLVMACASDGRLRVRVHLDERCAAFFALGVGRATGTPAAVVTTSGTAVANVLPAVVEAFQAAVPLLVLSADRPHRLRDSDANQAIDQVGIFGAFTRLRFDLSQPSDDPEALRHLRGVAARAVAAARAPDAGPVHVNAPFDKPLEPVEPGVPPSHDAAWEGRPGGRPFVDVAPGRATLPDEDLRKLAEVLSGRRGVIVAGPTPEPARVGPVAVALAARTGWPLLADPLSGARWGPDRGALRVAAYDLFLDGAAGRGTLSPEMVLRVGAAPTSAALQRWLRSLDGVEHVVVDGESRWKDHLGVATRYVAADATDTLERLCAHAGSAADPVWVGLWRRASEAALTAAADGGAPHEGDVASAVVRAAGDGALFVSSSMPIRDVDAFAPPAQAGPSVYANRGASGIDGIVSTACGVAVGSGLPTVCLLGDVAFFHDQNGLLWSREDDVRVVFVLVDNDGGGIFHMLPIAAHEPYFTTLFATPHGLDLSHAARLHDLPFEDAGPEDVEQAVRSALEAGASSVVRVRTERGAGYARRAEVRARVRAHVEEALADA